MSILSIQSHVSYGHVGNGAATFPLQSLGYEVWPVNTVNFSNHTGYGKWAGQVLPPDHVRAVIHGIWDVAADPCEAVLSGYVGDPAVGNIILEAVQHTKNQQSLYLCDPVMGDVGRGFFVKDGILDFFKTKGIPAANIITPNHFEAEALYGSPVHTLEEAQSACHMLSKWGPQTVVITSLEVPLPATDAHTISTLLFHQGHFWLGQTPRINFEIAPNGTGDLFSALYLGHFLKTQNPATALKLTLGHVYAIIEKTARLVKRELQIIGHNYGKPACVDHVKINTL